MFFIDSMSRIPIYEQLTSQIEKLVLVGVLSPEAQLPSVRSLSVSLSINPNTVQKAYADLCEKGVLLAVPGKGCFVSPNAQDIIKGRSRERLSAFEELVRELRLAGIDKQELINIIRHLYDDKE